MVFSTASTERVNIFETLLNFGGSLTTGQIRDYLNVSEPTAKRTMAELKALGLVTVDEIPSDRGEPQKNMTLDDKFGWFLSEEFIELKRSAYRKNFAPLLLDNTIQNCIVEDEGLGGHFSYSINNTLYTADVIHKSVLPRTDTK